MEVHFRMKLKRLVYIVTLIIAVSLMSFAYLHNNNNNDQALKPAPIPVPQLTQQPTDSDFLPWESVNIQRGDSLKKIFHRLNISQPTLKKILSLPEAKHTLIHLKSSQSLYLQRNDKHELLQLKYSFNQEKTLLVNKTSRGYIARIVNKPIESTLLYKSGVITHSLTEAAKRAGLTASQTKELSYLAAHDTSLHHRLRGDHFSILYREFYIDGKKYRPGDIVAAEFTDHKNTFQAIRYNTPNNEPTYYKPDGHSLESLFLNAPLHYTRISDRFKLIRLDPYTHQWRPHLGIDYAATSGTPVESIGDGEIVFRGHKGGYGNTVIIRYSRKYKALYGHLRHFAHPLYIGQHIHKGQTIGYVGSTGWATGPHLHFTVYVYGIPRNFLAMKLPEGRTIPKKFMPLYRQQAQRLLSQLQIYKNSEG